MVHDLQFTPHSHAKNTGHLDHILAADELRQQTSAAIFMHQDDLVLWSRQPTCWLIPS